ncbi:MAG TPA: LacI family DNA-binding transcriptional regulator [Bacteroides sp.]|nr:LacI family DNA-binding transcriptional regulator [Bacteroides sp.]
MKIRIKDIADRAGVSTGTIDRVIHGREEVSPGTRSRVLSILKEMRYEPDILASSLASRRPFRIAVLIPFHTPENWFWKDPMNGINNACSELNHFRIEVKEFLYDQFDKNGFLEKSVELLESFPDAVIAAPVFNHETREFFDRCHEQSIPFISMNDNIRHPEQVAYVGQDPRQSGAVAAQLMKTGTNGQGKILVISIARDMDNYNHILNREKGFREYWEKLNGSAVPEIITRAIPKDTYNYIKRTIGGMFEEFSDIRGIFVTNSRVYQVARFLHNTEQKNIMLVGYDLINPNIKYLNNDTIDYLISQKPHEQGYKALMTIFNALRLNKKPTPELLIPIDIICKENLCCYQV